MAAGLAPRRKASPETAEGLDLPRLEHDLLHQALHRSGGNRSRAARLLGLSRHQIRYRLKKSTH
jgi:DNA-binding protein Fis